MLAEITYSQPVLSAFLMLLAGILVGYALSYSLRGSTEAIKNQLQKLAEQNRELSAGLASIEELKSEAWRSLPTSVSRKSSSAPSCMQRKPSWLKLTERRQFCNENSPSCSSD